MTFLPKEYEVPASPSNYMKLVKGENRIRILSSAIIGYEYFNKENKPIRSREGWDEVPSDIKAEGKIKHFWAFVVWNYDLNKIQILELTQRTIMGAIKHYVDNAKWGDPKKYDFAITRSGDSLETEYDTIAEPHSPAPDEAVSAYQGMKVNLEALYTGADPFAPARTPEHQEKELEEIAKEVGF